MSTEPTPTPDPRPTTETPPTEIAARGREEPWTADDATADADSPAARSQLLFDPRSIARLRNLVDAENAYGR